MVNDDRPIILHIGDPIKYNGIYYEKEFAVRFRVVRNECLDRESLLTALRNQAFGQFSAIFRPHFQSGGEMGRWDKELIALLPPTVRIFASAGAGYDWADVDCLARHGIWYANGAGASDDAFTECHKTNALISRSPKGHTLGIVGLGNISVLLVAKAKALGMHVAYFDIARRSDDVEKELGLRYLSFKELLAQADCVSLHVPLTGNTRRLIDAKAISMMKPGARIVNTARGEIVNEQALIQALQTGHISAAGLDVHYNEPQVSLILASMENVTLTTHVAGGALDTRINFELNAMKNVVAVVEKRDEVAGKPLTPVNLPVSQ
ncbi:putative D-isomer specific 2-hydroxyacid dehydrogenase, catalytic domain-containing protein [Septoria linicola]|nr:putative D-isomer specific 2-hydroxyacid dehydrogenase, catalytic domain-containing protein [Septoria linicola]